MQRFFLQFEDVGGQEIVISDKEIIHQMKNVLRMKPGDRFLVCDGNGFEYLCSLTAIDEKQMKAQSIEKQKNVSESSQILTLYQSLPKKMELFEWVLQKGTEIGVSRFVPLVTLRGERTNFPKRSRLEKIIKEAAEQSGRGKIPLLEEAMDLKKILEKQFFHHAIMLHARDDYPLLSSRLPFIKKWQTVNLFIGPEGGFSAQEIERAQAGGALISSLGPHVLRTETAGIVAAGIVLLC